jgi:hypothetical protein
VIVHGVHGIFILIDKAFENNLNKKDIRPRNLKTKEPNQQNELDHSFN